MFQYVLKRLWSVKNKSFYGYGLKKIRTPRYKHVTMTLKYDKIAVKKRKIITILLNCFKVILFYMSIKLY